MDISRRIETFSELTEAALTDVMTRGVPALFKGAVSDWPAVQAARHSPESLALYLKSFDSGHAVGVMQGRPDGTGFYFYDADMDGFNFQRRQATLTQLVDALAAPAPDTPPLYAGPALSDEAADRFRQQNALPELPPQARPRLWLSNSSRVAAHYDVSRNIACCIAGRRTAILFPPDQVANLYMGPFEHTMAGPTVSMVDFHDPDRTRFPNFALAEQEARLAELEPGDALYIPTLWWHHIESFGSFNVLANHWWKPEHASTDFEGMIISLLGIRDQPAPERAAWRAFFEHFVFSDGAAQAADHLPPRWRTVTGPPSPAREQMLLRFMAGQLGERIAAESAPR